MNFNTTYVKNLYEITALSRSGHHAIIIWMGKNLTGNIFHDHINELSYHESKFKELNDNILHINQANCGIDWITEHLKKKSNIEHLFISYENTKDDYTIFSKDLKYKSPTHFESKIINKPERRKKIIIIRDFYNNLASRIKQNQVEMKSHNNEIIKWDIGEEFIETWKNYARKIINKECYYIKFEDWLFNSKKRRKFLLDILNIHEKYNDTEVEGTSSSFGNRNKQDLINRIKEIEIPEETKQIIRNDPELHYLIGKLNYQYIKI